MDGLCGVVSWLSGKSPCLAFIQVIAISKQVILLVNWLGFLSVREVMATSLPPVFSPYFADSCVIINSHWVMLPPVQSAAEPSWALSRARQQLAGSTLLSKVSKQGARKSGSGD